MQLVSHLLIWLGVLVWVEPKKSPLPPPSLHPYVMTMELVFNEDGVIDFITESFFATQNENLDANKNCNITLYDLITILPTDDLTPALDELNITLQGDDVTQLIRGLNYSELQTAGFSAKKAYRNMVNAYFQNATQALLGCLNILDITAEFTTAYAFGTDQELFQAFQRGNFSVYNLQEIFALANVPVGEIPKTLGLKRYDTPYFKRLINEDVAGLLMARGLQRDNLREFFEALELEVSDLKKIKSFKTFYKAHTGGESLGVAVGPNEVITNDDLLIKDLLNLDGYASLKVRSLQNSKVKHVVGVGDIKMDKEGFSSIRIEEDMASYIDRASGYDGTLLKNCTYITQDIKHRLVEKNVTVDVVGAKVTIPKLVGISYQMGSPLECGSLLYGLAEVNNFDSIGFTMVAEQAHVVNVDASALSGLLDLLTNFLQLFDVCSYTDCKLEAAHSQIPVETQEAQNEDQSKASVQSQVTPQIQAEVENQADNEEHNQAQVQPVFQTQSQAGVEIVEANNQSQNQSEVQVEAQSQSAIQIQGLIDEVKIQSDVQAQLEDQAQNQSEFAEQNQFGNAGGVQSEAQAQIQSELEAQNQMDNEAQNQSVFQFEIQEENAQNEAQIQTEAQAQVLSEIQAQNLTENKAQNQTVLQEDNAQIQAEAPAQVQSEIETIETQNQVENETSQTLIQSEIQDGNVQHQVEIQTEAQAQIQSEIETIETPNRVENEASRTLIQSEIQEENVQHQVQIQSEPQAQVQSEIEAENQPYIKENMQHTQDENQAQFQSEIEAQDHSKSEAGTSQTDNEEKVQLEVQSRPQIESDNETQAQAQIEEQNRVPGSNFQSEVQTQAQAEDDAGSKTEQEIQFEIENGIQVDSSVQIEGETQPQHIDVVL